MKILYQKPFESFNIPKSEESELWDIYITRNDNIFIYDETMWWVLCDKNLDSSIAEDFISLVKSNKGLYKEILDDLEFLDISRIKNLSTNYFYKAFKKNLKEILERYDQRTTGSTN